MLVEVSTDSFNKLYESLIQQLRSKQIDLYFRTEHPINQANGESFLHRASKKAHSEAISFLLSVGYDINRQDNQGNTPLYYAALSKKEEIVDLLLSQDANPNVGENGNTPLFAVIKGETLDENTEANIVKKLSDAGADVNQVTNEERFSPLQLAIIHRKVLIVKVIINTGNVDFLHKDIDEATVLHSITEYSDHTKYLPQTQEIIHRERKIAEFLTEHVDAINLQDNGKIHHCTRWL